MDKIFDLMSQLTNWIWGVPILVVFFGSFLINNKERRWLKPSPFICLYQQSYLPMRCNFFSSAD